MQTNGAALCNQLQGSQPQLTHRTAISTVDTLANLNPTTACISFLKSGALPSQAPAPASPCSSHKCKRSLFFTSPLPLHTPSSPLPSFPSSPAPQKQIADRLKPQLLAAGFTVMAHPDRFASYAPLLPSFLLPPFLPLSPPKGRLPPQTRAASRSRLHSRGHPLPSHLQAPRLCQARGGQFQSRPQGIAGQWQGLPRTPRDPCGGGGPFEWRAAAPADWGARAGPC